MGARTVGEENEDCGRPETEREAPCESADGLINGRQYRTSPAWLLRSVPGLPQNGIHGRGAPDGKRGSATWTGTLGEHLDDDAAILRATGLGLVRRNRLLFAVADDVDLVKRNLVMLVDVALYGLGALEAEAVVEIRRPGVVRVAFDLDVGAVGLGLQLLDELIDRRRSIIRQLRLTEFEVALVLAQDHFVDQPLRGLLDRIRAGVHGVGRGLRGVSALPGSRGLAVGRHCLAVRGLCLLIDFRDLGFVRPLALLGLFEALGERVDLLIHFPNLAAHELFGRARRGAAKGKGQHRYYQHESLHNASVYAPVRVWADLQKNPKLPTVRERTQA